MLAQAVLGGIVVKTRPQPLAGSPPTSAVALIFVADVTYVAVIAHLLGREGAAAPADTGFARLALFTAVATGTLLVVGTLVRAKGAGLAFTDWPLMNGRLVPALGGAATVMFAHRLLAALVFVLVLYMMVRARTMAHRSNDLVFLSTVLTGLFVAQIVVGAAQVWTGLKPWAVTLHIALSVLIWAVVVTLAIVSRGTQHVIEGEALPAPPRTRRRRRPARSPTASRPTTASRSPRSSSCCWSPPCRPCSLPRTACRRPG